MKKIVFSQSEKRVFIVAAAVCCIYIIYLSIFVPYQKRMSVFQGKILATQRQLKKNQGIIARRKDFEKRYQAILTDFRQQGTDAQAMTAILSEIEDANAQIHVRISDKKPRKAKTVDQYNQFSVDLTLEGHLSDIMHFIFVLQNSPHLFRVDELSMEKKSYLGSDLQCWLVLSRTLIP